DLRRHVRANRFDHRQVGVAATARRIEIDDVNPARTGGVEASRHPDRIVVIDRLHAVVPAQQTHDHALAYVDRRIEVHDYSPTDSTKLRSIRIPTSPDFSGWNCVAHRGPSSSAAANRRP